MNAFDKVIGYDAIKEELLQICDMLQNPRAYKSLGARLPHGVLLEGEPGLGKTLMAECFIEESGLKAYTLRRIGADDDFVGEITDTFLEAMDHAPAVVFLDDMDKFANEDVNHRDAKEYIAVQTGIDAVKESNVFVIATVNEPDSLPDSLIRPGRFDRIIEVHSPNDTETEQIIRHYLSGKKVSENVSIEDLAKMMNYSSCAELETILNEAAINAAYLRKSSVEMDDLVGAVLKKEYGSPENYDVRSKEETARIAMHEAGHAVVCETLQPGSVGLASVRQTGNGGTGGFTHRCTALPRLTDNVLVLLAGKAAVELNYPGGNADGCSSDIHKAANLIRRMMSVQGSCGFAMIEVSNIDFPKASENMNSRSEAVTQAELERYMFEARDILLANRKFLEKLAAALAEKGTLLYSDIQQIRKSVATGSNQTAEMT